MSSQKKNNTPNRSTEAFVPIKAISNGAIILDNNEKNRLLTKNFKKILSPEHSIAISASDKDEGKKIRKLSREVGVPFLRGVRPPAC